MLINPFISIDNFKYILLISHFSFFHYLLVRQYELQVGGKMTKSGDFSTVDLKKLMDEIETLRTRAEAAESSINDDNHRVTNGSPHHNNNSELSSPTFDHSVLALKENILRLDSEKATLENILLQREKKIELLEEDLRGPVPFEMGRYTRLCDIFLFILIDMISHMLFSVITNLLSNEVSTL